MGGGEDEKRAAAAAGTQQTKLAREIELGTQWEGGGEKTTNSKIPTEKFI